VSLALLLGMACTGQPEVPASQSPLDGSWLATVVDEPAQFTQLVEADRMGWIALHSNDLGKASGSSEPVSQRALSQLSGLHGELAHLDEAAWAATMATWRERGQLPEGSAIGWFAGLAALESGDDQAVQIWLQHAAVAHDERVRAAAAALAARANLDEPLPDALGNPLMERFNAHLSARVSGQVEGLLAERGPLWTEAAGKHERSFHDPQLQATLSQARAPKALPSTGLEALIWTGCLSEAALALGGCAEDTLLQLTRLELGGEDDTERAREAVRALDGVLDAWVHDRMDSASDDGQALLRDLRLAPRFRAEVLLGLARTALDEGRPHQALTLVQLAQDLETPRDIGPVNRPSLFAVMARAQLATGHTREALDALQTLTEAYPEATGTDEIVGDLAILQGLDRQGDSKEN
jgi:hypothetical protein